jgi:hypothetical protein
MYPGEMQLTRMFACAHSTASDAAKWRTAALAELYGLLSGELSAMVSGHSPPP